MGKKAGNLFQIFCLVEPPVDSWHFIIYGFWILRTKLLISFINFTCKI
ncbi:hypothetical protein ANACAC_01324 [Anaerostipes caccae L1-92]|uniref:Uncharacterized protein n=1 Tax=Anaerostipes caccae (strain DSM 14662 / CCUG 47493 / JCM 13470 / NCIMB 13811 / L1-92) TaxID=411490 RepID=B0MCN2_ANACD|nr:hypothetical protein ANACAC_01324 [Anaerostipes caccae L1-92]